MSDISAAVLQKQMGVSAPEMQKQAVQNTQNNGRSFENVLQQGGEQNSPNSESQNVNQVNQINDPKLEAMRVDLMQRYQNLPEGVPKITSIFPEYLDTKMQMTDFRKILSEAIGDNSMLPQGTDVKGSFAKVEDKWFELENLMRSDKQLSQGELLGLQARLYQVSQHIEVLSKVVDQMSSGVKTILNTNV